MLKFFRKIRKKLLDSGKTKAYLSYALGEIFLVVIGILIALQINNWNQDRLDSAKEAELVIALKDEFTINLAELDTIMKLNDQARSFLEQFVKLSGPEYEPLSYPEFAVLLKGITSYSIFYEPAQGVIDDMTNSGQLSNISNIELRRKLATWSANLDKILSQELLVESHRSGIREIVMKEGNLTQHAIYTGYAEHADLDFGRYQFENDGRLLLTNNELTNIILFKLMASDRQQRFYSELRKEIEQILEILQREINKH